jgi:hypothetical protein
MVTENASPGATAMPTPDTDAYYGTIREFFRHIAALPSGTLLELGSRNRSGNTIDHKIPPGWKYIGADVLAGEHVDLIADAHELSRHVAPRSIDAVFSRSTFEHLAMLWKAVLEINQILVMGGLVLIASHQTWPVHEYPCDYFRFSDQAWHSLLNPATGFEIIRTGMGLTASVRPHVIDSDGVAGLEAFGNAYLGSAVLARKIKETTLRWDVSLTDIANQTYPL